jgi:hypothetical protein
MAMAMLATTNTFSSSSHVTARRRMICAIKKLVPFCSSELSQNKSPVKRWIFDHATPKNARASTSPTRYKRVVGSQALRKFKHGDSLSRGSCACPVHSAVSHFPPDKLLDAFGTASQGTQRMPRDWGRYRVMRDDRSSLFMILQSIVHRQQSTLRRTSSRFPRERSKHIELTKQALEQIISMVVGWLSGFFNVHR